MLVWNDVIILLQKYWLLRFEHFKSNCECTKGYMCEGHNNPSDFFLDIINEKSSAVQSSTSSIGRHFQFGLAGSFLVYFNSIFFTIFVNN